MVTAIHPNVILQLNTVAHSISYQSVTKYVDDSFWNTEIIPILYPLWHSDRDKLEIFAALEGDTYYVTRNKYTRDYTNDTAKWVSYEYPLAELDPVAAKDLKDKLVEKFIEYRENINNGIEGALQAEFINKTDVTWEKVRLIRNFLLQDSDFAVLPDSQITDGNELQMWKDYRQKLRDIPGENWATPYDCTFPITPTEYKTREEFGIPESVQNQYGNFGKGDAYLSNKEFHYWRPTHQTLESWKNRMALYVALRVRSSDHRLNISNIFTHSMNNMHHADPLQPNINDTSSTWIDNLLKSIEAGEV